MSITCETILPLLRIIKVNMSYFKIIETVKTFIYIFIISLLAILWTCEVHAAVPIFKKSKSKTQSSCTIFRGKFTTSDMIEYRFGVVAGQNIATIKSQKGDSQDIITGLVGGAVFQMVWPKGFALQPEVLYSQKGCIFTGEGLRYDIDYIEIPVKIMYRLHMSEVKPFAFVAPYGAYAIRLKEKGDIVGDDVYSNKINKLDYGIGAGAGFDVWKIQLSFKYSWGFARVIDETFPVRNKVFTLSAGLLF